MVAPLEKLEPQPEENWPLSQESMDWDDGAVPPPDPSFPVTEPQLPAQERAPIDPQPQVEPQPVPPEPEPEPVELAGTPKPESPPAPAIYEDQVWSPVVLSEHCPEPRYPSKARRRKQEGAVVLLLTVDSKGNVTEVEIVESSGHSILDQAAKKTLATWRFATAPITWAGGSTQVRRRILFRLPS
ncbi:MAG: energy transducer TonB [bacterium]|nr:energy transducer TonB [bacterium]